MNINTQLPCLARPMGLFHHLITPYDFKQHTDLPEPRAQHLSEKSSHLCHAHTSPSSKLSPAPFTLTQSKKQKQGRRAQSSQHRSIFPIAKLLLLYHLADLGDFLLCSCSHSVLRTREARTDSCGLSAEKGSLCLLAS